MTRLRPRDLRWNAEDLLRSRLRCRNLLAGFWIGQPCAHGRLQLPIHLGRSRRLRRRLLLEGGECQPRSHRRQLRKRGSSRCGFGDNNNRLRLRREPGAHGGLEPEPRLISGCSRGCGLGNRKHWAGSAFRRELAVDLVPTVDRRGGKVLFEVGAKGQHVHLRWLSRGGLQRLLGGEGDGACVQVLEQHFGEELHRVVGLGAEHGLHRLGELQLQAVFAQIILGSLRLAALVGVLLDRCGRRCLRRCALGDCDVELQISEVADGHLHLAIANVHGVNIDTHLTDAAVDLDLAIATLSGLREQVAAGRRNTRKFLRVANTNRDEAVGRQHVVHDIQFQLDHRAPKTVRLGRRP
mmetsp:Transcript_165750/g.532212  ORF Transcript_165750/g.532212 Transcript_165750/m.532212 type:complete len:352 (-) Transcript_165750:65-1120(-)